jgi:hypothetical protein
MAKTDTLVPADRIERSILFIRGHKVMLDSDLAALYGVQTRQLVQTVKRNRERFPPDFAYQLTRKEFTNLKSQFGISNSGATGAWGGRRTLPFVFIEQGVAMLSSVLHSERAISVNIEIMRAFVRLRQLLLSHADLARRLDELEKKYDKQFAAVFEAIRRLMAPPESSTVEIGYYTLVPKR